MTLPTRCPLCDAALRGAATVHEVGSASADLAVDCTRCGRYVLSPASVAVMELADPEDRAQVARWIAERRAAGTTAALRVRPEDFVGA